MEKERAMMAMRFGQWTGKQCRRFIRGEAEAIRWLKGKKLPAYVATILVWVIRLSILLLMLLAVILLAVVFMIVYVYAKCVGSSVHGADAGTFGEQRDHKQSVFYDPINYNDPDDPRFDD